MKESRSPYLVLSSVGRNQDRPVLLLTLDKQSVTRWRVGPYMRVMNEFG
jgi:hypothetical protein